MTFRPLIPSALALALLATCSQAPQATPASATTVTAAVQTSAGSAIAGAIETIRTRMHEQMPANALVDANTVDVLALVTEEEMATLSTGFLQFSVDTPATVYVLLSPDSDDEPFWLATQGFERTDLVATVDGDDEFRAWRKPVEAGEVGLGVHSIESGVKPYFVLVGPAAGSNAQPVVSAPVPARMGVATATTGTRVFADDTDTLDAIEPALQGLAMLQTLEKRENEAALLGWFRNTPYPGSAAADHVVLTWAGDPATTQSN